MPPFSQGFYPLHLAVLTVADNLMPLGYWTVCSKEPFRFFVAVGNANYTLTLVRQHHEAALNFLPWSERERVVRAGYLSGREVRKAAKLGLRLKPAEALKTTQLLEAAENVFELRLLKEVEGISADHGTFVFDVVAAHITKPPEQREPILFLGEQNFAPLGGERWRFRR